MQILNIWIVATICILGMCCAFGETLESDGNSDESRQLQKPKKIGECDISCTRDSDCVKGLLCAKQHQAKLSESGWSKRRAYCSTKVTQKQYVCFDPKFLNQQICPETLPTGSCNVTTDKPCVSLPYCCRRILKTMSGGRHICAPQTCFSPSGCQCAPLMCAHGNNSSSWACYIADPSPFCVPSSECVN